MSFNTMPFAGFFLLVAAGFFVLPKRGRCYFLLVASYLFYMSWVPGHAILLLAATGVNYACALAMGWTTRRSGRTLLLVVGVAASLGLLCFYKYANFVSEVVHQLTGPLAIPWDVPVLKIVLPIGISFYTFQALGYTIDVYRGRLAPERHPVRFALYVSFFPQLVAGPIERGANLLPQFRRPQGFDADRAWDGVQLMVWGLFKKMVVADRLAIYVNAVYNNVPNHDGLSYVIATYFFAFQIYCDFSGYSDIAVGAARVLGYDLMKNFDRPYFAPTTAAFWRRWHISLSTWLRDYLYIPLGGNRKGRNRTYLNLMVTMLLGGIWHGANWTFLLWGLFHGCLLCGSRMTLAGRDRLAARLHVPGPVLAGVRMLVTFHLVCLGWVLFRANTVGDAVHVLTHLFTGWPNVYVEAPSIVFGVAGIVAVLCVQCVQTRCEIRRVLARRSIAVRWAVHAVMVFAIVVLRVDAATQFVYFQF